MDSTLHLRVDMINVRCRTNLDGFDTTRWPNEISCRPMVGDSIYSITNDGKGRRKLKIVSIAHGVFDDPVTKKRFHFLELELSR